MIRHSLFLASVVCGAVLFGCGGETQGTTSDSGSPHGDGQPGGDAGPGGDGGVQPDDAATDKPPSPKDTGPPPISGFCSTTTAWSLPPAPVTGADWMDSTQESVACSGGTSFRAQLTDLDGDARPDLVITDLCDAGGVGHSHWDVYKNTGKGFASTPTKWSLPTPPITGADWMDSTQESISCGDGTSFRAQLTDLDGDARPDLVITDLCDAGGAGHTAWIIYKNTGKGFAATPTKWSLPTPPITGADWMDSTQESIACGDGTSFRAQLTDLDGDARPDLLITDLCDAGGAGHTTWIFYKNTGKGFAATPAKWTLPTPPITGADWMDSTQESISCGDGTSFRAQLTDLDGDARPDLLITDLCDAGGAGHTDWIFYKNTGSGFSSKPAKWALPTTPPVSGADWMDSTQESVACTGGTSFQAQLTDIDGDARPDLLITDLCDAGGAGHTDWIFYKNTGSGFSSKPAKWTLPTPPVTGADWMDSTQESVACTGSTSFRAQISDLDGDGRPDLLLTDLCDASGVGTANWQLFTNGVCR